MSTDLTFVTNEDGRTLSERFKVLIKNTKFFDCLVGYFYTSGFYQLYPSLEATEKIRILIGINTNPQTYKLIKESGEGNWQKLTTKETKEAYSKQVETDLEHSPDTVDVERGASFGFF